MQLIKCYLYILLLLFPTRVFSQVSLSGSVSDSSGKAIAGATLTIKQKDSEIISAFSLSDDKGNFKFDFELAGDSVQLSVSHLAFEDKTLFLKNSSQQINVKLGTKVKMLPNVIVSPPPIYKRNDTVNYNVGAFTSKEDRVIGDIIKKLPGVEMEGNKILYQGKPIQKYFIDGMDLLEGRYGLANNNLPVDAVQKVQIIENDQPIKILDSLIFSDRASLNVQLKKYTTTGTAKIGAGFSPFLREVNITPMTFNKSFQTINTLQSNNIGDDVSRQLRSLSVGNMFDISDFGWSGEAPPTTFVNIQSIAVPNFDEKRWLDNNINLVSSNFLKKLSGNLEFKGSVSFFNDFKKRAGQSLTTFFTPEKTITVEENINNSYNVNNLDGNFILLKNEKNVYFKNNLQVSKQWFSDNGILLNDGNLINQRKQLQNFRASNRFSGTTFWGKQLVTLNSFIGYNNTPQSILVRPGILQNVLNDSVSYDAALQNIALKDFNTDNYISFVKSFKGFVIMPKIGTSYQAQQINSHININEAGKERNTLGERFQNDLHFYSSIIYADIKTQYQRRKWRMEINTPVRFRNYVTNDQIRNIRTPLSRITIEPGFFSKLQLSANWEATVSSSYFNQFSTIQSLYNGYILGTYRNLQRFNSRITEGNTWSSGLSFDYKNTLKSAFAGINYRFSVIGRNYLLNNVIDGDGFSTIDLAFRNNTQQMHFINANCSKYFRKIKTIIKTSGSANWTRSDYLFGQSVKDLKTKTYSGSIQINNTSLSFLSAQFETRATVVNSFLSGSSTDRIFMNNNYLEMSVFPVDNHTLTLKSEYYITNIESQRNQFFLDAVYRTTIPKTKIDIELTGINLLNNNQYARLYNLDFIVVKNFFQLRPRQIMASVRFKF